MNAKTKTHPQQNPQEEQKPTPIQMPLPGVQSDAEIAAEVSQLIGAVSTAIPCEIALLQSLALAHRSGSLTQGMVALMSSTSLAMGNHIRSMCDQLRISTVYLVTCGMITDYDAADAFTTLAEAHTLINDAEDWLQELQ